MVDISPFRGVHYNQVLVKDLKSVICPPYDIITPEMAHELYRRSEYNFIRLEYTRQLPSEEGIEDRLAHSAATLQLWLEQGVLEADRDLAVYLHDHHFTHQGRDYNRATHQVAPTIYITPLLFRVLSSLSEMPISA